MKTKHIYCALLLIHLASLFGCSHISDEGKVDLENANLFIQEVLVPIPDSMTNDWNFIAESMEDGEKLVYVFDLYSKGIHSYSLDRMELKSTIFPFSSDTLSAMSVIPFRKITGGYQVNTEKGLLQLTDKGLLNRKWDHPFQRSNPIPDFTYGQNLILFSSDFKMSGFDDSRVPITYRLINTDEDGVYQDQFYEKPLFGEFNFNTGELINYPISLPENFRSNGTSYPSLFAPKFTAFGEKKLAYLTGLDDLIQIFDITTNEITSYKVTNPDFKINIYPIDEATLKNPDQYREYRDGTSIYNGLHYDPVNSIFLRFYSGSKSGAIKKNRYVEILNEDLELLSYFTLDKEFLGATNPLFFPGEIWFPYFMGYGQDEMKFTKIVLDL